MSKESLKKYIVIVGMHRSGTSLLANLLNQCSVSFGNPNNLLEPNFDNRFGFFENKKLVKINNSILECFDLTWDTTKKISYMDDSGLLEEKRMASNLIKRISRNAKVIALKDPRMSITFPFWTSILGSNVKILFMLRNPLEIADSLKRRNSFSKSKSLAIWENYLGSILTYIKEQNYLIVKYEDIINDSFPQFKRILRYLELEYSRQSLKSMFFTIDRDVRHSTHTDEEFFEDDNVSTKKKNLYKEVLKNYQEQLDSHPIGNSHVSISTKERMSFLCEKNKKLGLELDKAREKVNENREELSEKSRVLFLLENKISEMAKEINYRDKKILTIEEELKRKDRTLDNIYNSGSWKMTQPIRYMRKKIKDLL